MIKVSPQRAFHRAVQTDRQLVLGQGKDELILLNLFVEQVYGCDGVEDARLDADEPDDRQVFTHRSPEALVLRCAPLITTKLVAMQAIGSLAVLVRQEARLRCGRQN